MSNKEEYDFVEIGQRHAKDGIENLRKLADQYGREFGLKARRDFETGVASVIPQFARFYVSTSENEEVRVEGATHNYGMDNLRNNSYFGGDGYSQQFVDGEYNEPPKTDAVEASDSPRVR